jgi:hypothetical protein
MFTQEEKEVIQDAITKISAIPSEDIIVNSFTDKKSKCCVVGHLTRLGSKNPNDYSQDNCTDWTSENDYEGLPIRQLSVRYFENKNGFYESLAGVNNGENSLYKQETPKERSLALLQDMLKTETVEIAEA